MLRALRNGVNKQDLRSSISSLFDLCVRWGISDWSNVAGFNSVTSDPEFLSVALDKTSSYEAVYRAALERRSYNFILSDLSFFQFSLQGRNHTHGLRFAYYPCPYLAQDVTPAIRDVQFGDQRLVEMDISIGFPPIRYDYSPNQYTAFQHPASHIHIGHATPSRLATRSVLTPKAFGLLALRLAHRSLNSNQTELPTVDLSLATEWPRLEDVAPDLFSTEEASYPHLA